jgi:hypothetical protein
MASQYFKFISIADSVLDYDNDSPALIQDAKNNFDNAIKGTNPASSDFLAIAHDIHEQTAHNLTKYMLDGLLAKGYRLPLLENVSAILLRIGIDLRLQPTARLPRRLRPWQSQPLQLSAQMRPVEVRRDTPVSTAHMAIAALLTDIVDHPMTTAYQQMAVKLFSVPVPLPRALLRLRLYRVPRPQHHIRSL